MRLATTKLLGLTLLLMIFCFSSLVMAEDSMDGQQSPKAFKMKGRLTIEFAEGVDLSHYSNSLAVANFNIPSLDRILAENQVAHANVIFPGKMQKIIETNLGQRMKRFYEISFPDSVDIDKLAELLRQNPNIKLVEPVYALPLYSSIPNDNSFADQWHLDDPGDHDVDAPEAWDMERGSSNIIIAIIDSGVNHKHRDLKANIWVNPGEDIDGDRAVFDVDDRNYVDDDGNGYVDDLIGYDFFSGGFAVPTGEDGGTPDYDPIDFNGHGTHCAGIAAAVTNNVNDVAGVAGGWGNGRYDGGIQIMCLRVGASATSGLGQVNSNNCGTAIQYAAENGAKIINCSWGSQSTTTMELGMQACAAYGVTVCHAAGNDNNEQYDYLDLDPYTSVLSVASTTSGGFKSDFSNYGTWVDISAPGSSIFSTSSDGPSGNVPITEYSSGTSMASPLVAGVAGLVWSAMPTLSKAQVDSILINTAVDIDPLNPSYAGKLGSGLVNAYNAVSALPIALFEADATQGNIPFTVQFTDLSPVTPTAWTWDMDNGDMLFVQNPQYTFNSPGLYDISLTADVAHPLGDAYEIMNDYIWVTADTIRIDSINVEPDTTVVVPVYLRNTQQVKDIQFCFSINGPADIVSPYITTGPRTSGFYDTQLNGYDPPRYGFKMIASDPNDSDYMTTDTGIIVYIHLYIPAASSGVVTIDTATVGGSIKPNITTIMGSYWPYFEPGIIVVESQGCCVGMRGNFNGDAGDAVNVVDLTALVGYLFGGGSEPACWEEGNINGDFAEAINVVDLTYLVGYLFGGGAAPASCP